MGLSALRELPWFSVFPSGFCWGRGKCLLEGAGWMAWGATLRDYTLRGAPFILLLSASRPPSPRASGHHIWPWGLRGHRSDWPYHYSPFDHPRTSLPDSKVCCGVISLGFTSSLQTKKQNPRPSLLQLQEGCPGGDRVDATCNGPAPPGCLRPAPATSLPRALPGPPRCPVRPGPWLPGHPHDPSEGLANGLPSAEAVGTCLSTLARARATVPVRSATLVRQERGTPHRADG